MTAKFNLGLPTDIPWRRIGVTEYMMDRKGRDDELPPQWNSSIAVFEYVPEESFQPYEDLEVSYVKVTATITGYQPSDKEITGEIDWDRLNKTTLKNVDKLLKEFQPCTGAILQVSVTPEEASVPLDEYPYFSDFQPKRRDLYELATASNSVLSRSGENLAVGKSSMSTNSLEVLDIDMGFSAGVSAGVGKGSGGIQFGHNQNVGTKSLGSTERGTNRIVDRSQEKRESESFTTQLSQVYSQLKSYHAGTNRAMFLMQPRPHTIAQDNGFVRGPNSLDGIQEFFLVVVKKKNQKTCINVKLDTAHLTDVDIYEYDYKYESLEEEISASAPVSPHDSDTVLIERRKRAIIPHNGATDYVYYDYYKKTISKNLVYISRFKDYSIDLDFYDGYRIVERRVSPEASASIGTISISSDRKTLQVTLSASGYCGFNPVDDFYANPPRTQFAKGSSAKISLLIRLKSDQPIRKIGTRQVLMIATSSVTTCRKANSKPTVGIIKTIPLSDLIEENKYKFADMHDVLRGMYKENYKEILEEFSSKELLAEDPIEWKFKLAMIEKQRRETLTPSDANVLSNIFADLLKETSTPSLKDTKVKPYILTDIFAEKLYDTTLATPERREILSEPVRADLVRINERELEEALRFPLEEATRQDLFNVNVNQLTAVARIDENLASKVKLEALGLTFRDNKE